MYIRLDTGEDIQIKGFEIKDSEGDLLQIKEEGTCCRIFWKGNEDVGLKIVQEDLGKLIRLCEAMQGHLASTG